MKYVLRPIYFALVICSTLLYGQQEQDITPIPQETEHITQVAQESASEINTQQTTLTQVLERLQEENTHFVMFAFTDLMGNLKEITVPISQVKSALINGLSFDSSSIAGYSSITESDMILKPDMSTLRFLPWTQEGHRTALFICTIYKNLQEPYEADARYILSKACQELSELGYQFHVGPEVEFFLLKRDKHGKPLLKPCDTKKYTDAETNFVRQQENHIMLEALLQLDIKAEKLHHEVASGQHEISIAYGDALQIADQLIIAKYALTVLAQQMGLHVTFMPKPLFGQNGNGMHIHYSLYNLLENKNAFYAQDQEHNLSLLAKAFLAGNLSYIRQFSSILNPTINSYKRLVPGYEAPIYLCWGNKNRSSLIRIPLIHGDAQTGTRAEIRCPDALTNPYLAFTVLLKTGLLGIKQRKKLPEQTKDNVYKLSQEERKKRGIISLPTSLHQALDELEQSSIAQEILGQRTITEFLYIKRKECSDYDKAVTDWEHERYL